MSETATSAGQRSALLATTGTPAPGTTHWAIAGTAAIALHAVAALPFLPEPVNDPAPVIEEEGPEIGVNLAPFIQPPEPEQPPPEPEPEPEPEPQVIQERAEDSPPPAPPAEPREVPDLPEIQPQIVPDLWTGRPGSGSEGQLSLEEYLFLRDWLTAARAQVLERISYPYEAARLQITGSAEVIITVNREGEIVSWRFMRQAGNGYLDNEVSRTINGIRRLPRFPEGTTRSVLSYTLTIRFELVMPDGTILTEDTAPADAPAAPSQAPAGPAREPQNMLDVGALAQCASLGEQVNRERERVLSQRDALQAIRTEYEEQSARYRRQQDLPRRVENLLEDYNENVGAFNGQLAAFNARTERYTAMCGGKSVTFEDYARVCGPYLEAGNAYCETFAGLWTRLGEGG